MVLKKNGDHQVLSAKGGLKGLLKERKWEAGWEAIEQQLKI